MDRYAESIIAEVAPFAGVTTYKSDRELVAAAYRQAARDLACAERGAE